KDPERVDERLLETVPVGGASVRLLDPHRPGWSVAGRSRALIGDDVVVAHAGEVVVRLVVFADMIEAEVEVLALLVPAFRRAVAARLAASLPFAGRRLGSLALAIRIDADAVEIFGVQVHHAD